MASRAGSGGQGGSAGRQCAVAAAGEGCQMWSLAQEALWLAALPPTHPHRADYLAEKAVRDSVLRTVERDRGEGPWPSSPIFAPRASGSRKEKRSHK